MFILVRLLVVFLSTRLLDNKLHCLDTQSHFGVHLYLDGMQVVVQELTEANELTQRIFNAFLERQFTNLNTDTSIRSSLLHGSWELGYNFLRELLIVISNCWCILNATCVFHFKQEDSSKCTVLLRLKINLKNNTNIVI